MDELEAEFKENLVVVRLNIQDSSHQAIIEECRVRGTPTFIFLNASGLETWRSVGAFDPAEIRELVAAP